MLWPGKRELLNEVTLKQPLGFDRRIEFSVSAKESIGNGTRVPRRLHRNRRNLPQVDLGFSKNNSH